MTETRHQVHRAEKKPLAKRGRPHMTGPANGSIEIHITGSHSSIVVLTRFMLALESLFFKRNIAVGGVVIAQAPEV
ncbi:hypothetical protein [Methylocystis hirsuta]|uniref:hypothetical protein n=1 Tax=Methylocystis hirsuta TaxID=369798 RepID=UPI001474C63F|nr:hypothetical protein [Methylocystis hirsuta]